MTDPIFTPQTCERLRKLRASRLKLTVAVAELKQEIKELDEKIVGEDEQAPRRNKLCRDHYDARRRLKRAREQEKLIDAKVYAAIGEGDQMELDGIDTETGETTDEVGG